MMPVTVATAATQSSALWLLMRAVMEINTIDTAALNSLRGAGLGACLVTLRAVRNRNDFKRNITGGALPNHAISGPML